MPRGKLSHSVTLGVLGICSILLSDNEAFTIYHIHLFDAMCGKWLSVATQNCLSNPPHPKKCWQMHIEGLRP